MRATIPELPGARRAVPGQLYELLVPALPVPI
jgi:hypothetical protein